MQKKTLHYLAWRLANQQDEILKKTVSDLRMDVDAVLRQAITLNSAKDCVQSVKQALGVLHEIVCNLEIEISSTRK